MSSEVHLKESPESPSGVYEITGYTWDSGAKNYIWNREDTVVLTLDGHIRRMDTFASDAVFSSHSYSACVAMSILSLGCGDCAA
jgi:hypothetical protein